MHVARVFEQSVHCFLSCGDVIDVCLALSNFLLEGLDCGCSVLELIKSCLESRQVVDLSLDPVVKVSERVAQVLDGMAKVLNDITLLHVVDNKPASISFNIVAQVLILVRSQSCGSASVAFDQHLLVGQVAGDIVLHLLQESLCLLEEYLEFKELGLEDVLFLLVERLDVDHSGLLEALKQLGRGHLDEALKGLLDIKALRARKNLELFAIDDEVELAELAHESLEVEAALLQEDDVLVSHCLFGRHLGQEDTGPALLQALLEEEEFVVAALDLKISL